jgi:hypothetical protein
LTCPSFDILANVDKLEAAADAAAKKAREAKAEFDRNVADYNRLPAEIKRVNDGLTELSLTRENVEAADDTFKAVFKAVMSGARMNPAALTESALAIATKSLRLEVLDELDAEAKATLKSLQKKQDALRSTLGLK